MKNEEIKYRKIKEEKKKSHICEMKEAKYPDQHQDHIILLGPGRG